MSFSFSFDGEKFGRRDIKVSGEARTLRLRQLTGFNQRLTSLIQQKDTPRRFNVPISRPGSLLIYPEPLPHDSLDSYASNSDGVFN